MLKRIRVVRITSEQTDAAIAAIRAEGVEMFAVTIPNLVKPMVNEHYFESKAVEFAAQLREGAQK